MSEISYNCVNRVWMLEVCFWRTGNTDYLLLIQFKWVHNTCVMPSSTKLCMLLALNGTARTSNGWNKRVNPNMLFEWTMTGEVNTVVECIIAYYKSDHRSVYSTVLYNKCLHIHHRHCIQLLTDIPMILCQTRTDFMLRVFITNQNCVFILATFFLVNWKGLGNVIVHRVRTSFREDPVCFHIRVSPA